MQTGNISRFAPLFSQTAPTAIWDNVVLRTGPYVVAPTRGSIVPMWLLVVPQEPVLNFARMRESERRAPVQLLAEISSSLGFGDSGWLWFEHGAPTLGSVVGCGVDHAHLHLVLAPPFDLTEFASRVHSNAPCDWLAKPSEEAYVGLTGSESYYAFGDASRSYVATNVELGSQFFRRVIAELVERPAEWDYRLYDGDDVAAQTLDRLSRLAASPA